MPDLDPEVLAQQVLDQHYAQQDAGTTAHVGAVVSAARKRLGEKCGPEGCAAFVSRSLKDSGYSFGSPSSSALRAQILRGGGQEVTDPQPGDLFFHTGGPTGYSHTGIVGPNSIIDAPGRSAGYASLERPGKPRLPAVYVRLPSRSGNRPGRYASDVQDLLPTQAQTPEERAQAVLSQHYGSPVATPDDPQALAEQVLNQHYQQPSANPVVAALQRRSQTAIPPSSAVPIQPAPVSASAGIGAQVSGAGAKPASAPAPTSISGAALAQPGAIGAAGAIVPRLDPLHVRPVQPAPAYVAQHPVEAVGEAAKHVFAGNYAGAEEAAAQKGATTVTVPKGKEKEVTALQPLVQKYVEGITTRAKSVESRRGQVLPPHPPGAGDLGAYTDAPNPAAFPSTEAYLQARSAYQARVQAREHPTNDYASRLATDETARQEIYNRAAQQLEDLPRALESQGAKLTPYQKTVLKAAGHAQAEQMRAEMAKRRAGTQDVIANVAGYLTGMTAEEILGPWIAKAGGAIAAKVLPKLGAEGQAAVQSLAGKPVVQAVGRILSPTRAVGNYAGGAGAQGVTDITQNLTPAQRLERANQAGLGAAAFGMGLHAAGEVGGAVSKAVRGKKPGEVIAPVEAPTDHPVAPVEAATAPAEASAGVGAAPTFGDVMKAQAQIEAPKGEMPTKSARPQNVPTEPPVRPQVEKGAPSPRPFIHYDDLIKTPEGKPLPHAQSETLANVHALMTNREGLSGSSWDALEHQVGPDAIVEASKRLDDPHYKAEAERILQRREAGQYEEAAQVKEQVGKERAGQALSGRPLVEEAISLALPIERDGVKYYDLQDEFNPEQRQAIYDHVKSSLGRTSESKLFAIPGVSKGASLHDAIVDMGVVPHEIGKRYEAGAVLSREFIPRNKEELTTALKAAAKLKPKQAQDTAEIFDAYVQARAKTYGKASEQVYEDTLKGSVRGGKVSEDALTQAQSHAPTFYSQAERVVDEKMPNRASVAQLRGTLNSGGVKPEELRWTGLDEWLGEKEKGGVPVTKAEVQEFLRSNRVEVKEVQKGEHGAIPTRQELELDFAHEDANDWNHWADQIDPGGTYTREEWDALSPDERAEIVQGTFPEYYRNKANEEIERLQLHATERGENPTKFGQYVLPGGKNYRELLLTLPEHADQKRWEAQADGEIAAAKAKIREAGLSEGATPFQLRQHFGEEEGTRLANARMGATSAPPPARPSYHSGHWDEPNVLAHVRFDERVDAEGKKVLHVAEIQSDWHQAGRKQGYAGGEKYLDAKFETQAQAETAAQRANTTAEYDGQAWRLLNRPMEHDSRVPAAPFAKTWHELALRTILRKAAEMGVDRVTWDTGATAAERFDLSKQVNRVVYNEPMGVLQAYQVGTGRKVVDELGVPPEKLPDYIGKEAAEKLLAQEPDQTHNRQLVGEELKVGGSGMAGFYDKILPQYAEKYGKKWGAKVGVTEVVQGSSFGQNEKGVYTGPDATIADIQRVLDTRRETVSVEQSLRDVRDAMRQGATFHESIGQASPAAARALGGDLRFEAAKNTAPTHFIDVTPQMKESVLAGQPLFQGEPASPKGAVQFDEHGRAFIRFFQSSDVSTALHELVGHVMRRGLEGEDLKIAESWAEVEDGNWTRPAEEKFARGFERYMRDGKAPTDALKSVFGRMRDWLIQIYKRVTGSDIDVKVSPEMRDLFDRQLGGEGYLKKVADREAAKASAKPPPDMIGSVNADKLNVPDAAKEVIHEAYQTSQKAVDEFRRGERSNASTLESAKRLLTQEKITVETLKRAHPGQAWNAEQLEAIGMLHLRLLREMQAAETKYQASGSVEDYAGLVDAKTKYEVVSTAHQGGATEVGRALQARKLFKSAYEGEMAKAKVEEMYKALPDTPDRTQLRRTAAMKATVFPRERGVQALAKLRERFGAPKPEGEQVLYQKNRSAIPPDLRGDLIDLGGWLVESKFNTETVWRAEMQKQLGDGVEPYLPELWKQVKAEAQARAKKVTSTKSAQDQAKAVLDKILGGREPAPDVLERMKAAGNDPVALAKVVQDQYRPTPSQIFVGGYKSSLTMGIGTHLTNIGSTLTHIQLRRFDKFFSGLWDPAVSKLTGRERQHFIQEAAPNLAAMQLGFRSGVADFAHTMKEGATEENLRGMDIPQELPGGLKNPLVVNMRLLGAEDAFSKALVYHEATYSEATRLALKEGLKGAQLKTRVAELLGSDAVKEKAWAEAKEYTFNSDPDVLVKGFLQARSKLPPMAAVPLHVAAPFISTPVNVAKSAWMHSPAGVLTAISRVVSGGDVADALGKATTGTLIMTGLGALLKNTELTGPVPSDPSARDDFYRSGRQPYAMKIGGVWLSYANQGPLTTMLASLTAMRADYWSKGKTEPLPVWLRASLAAAQSIKEQSALTGLSAISDAVDSPEHKGMAWLKSAATGLVPFSGLLRTLTKATDPYMRETKNVPEAVQAIVPGMSQRLPQKLDNFGRPVKREPSGPLAVQRFVVGKESKDAVDAELHRLKVFPSRSSDTVKVGKDERKLTRTQYDQYQRIVGEVLYARLQHQVSTPGYQDPKVPDEIRVKALRQIINRTRNEGEKGANASADLRYSAEDVLKAALARNADPIKLLQVWRDRALNSGVSTGR